MRQALAKGVRRDLRRAFGEGVLETVDTQGSRLEGMANTVNSLRRELIAIELDHTVLKSDVATVIDQAGWAVAHCKDQARRIDAEQQRVSSELRALSDCMVHLNRWVEPVNRKLWGRLRWLFTGA